MRTAAPKDASIAANVPAQSSKSGARSTTELLAAPRRINMPKAVAGGLGVVACSLGFAATSNLFAAKTPVLVVAQPIRPGQVITTADLRAVAVAADPGTDMIPASQAASVVNRPAAVPLAPGAVLGHADVGSAAFPPPGEAVTAVALKAGSYPLNLAAGDRVQVVPASAQATTTTTTTPAADPSNATSVIAVVTAVSKPDTQGTVVADLLLDEASAAKVAAAAPTGMSLTVLSPGAS